MVLNKRESEMPKRNQVNVGALFMLLCMLSLDSTFHIMRKRIVRVYIYSEHCAEMWMRRTHRKKEKSGGRNRTEKIRDYDNLENVEPFPAKKGGKAPDCIYIYFLYLASDECVFCDDGLRHKSVVCADDCCCFSLHEWLWIEPINKGWRAGENSKVTEITQNLYRISVGESGWCEEENHRIEPRKCTYIVLAGWNVSSGWSCVFIIYSTGALRSIESSRKFLSCVAWVCLVRRRIEEVGKVDIITGDYHLWWGERRKRCFGDAC